MKRAFTLIELLVVIAIIAILAAILFPVFAQAKVAAKKTADLSNNKQLNLSIIMYQTDSDDSMPWTVPGDNGTTLFTTPWDRDATANPTLRQEIFGNSLAPYIKNWNMWTSPGKTVDWLPFAGNPGPGFPNPTNFAQSYTMNSYLNTMAGSMITAPAAAVTFWAGMGTTDLPGFTFAMPLIYTKTDGWLAPNQFSGDDYVFLNSGANCVALWGWFGGAGGTTANYNVFSGGMNVASADGHAKFAKNGSFNSPIAATNADGTMAAFWVNSTDCTLGCCYSYTLSPFRTQ